MWRGSGWLHYRVQRVLDRFRTVTSFPYRAPHVGAGCERQQLFAQRSLSQRWSPRCVVWWWWWVRIFLPFVWQAFWLWSSNYSFIATTFLGFVLCWGWKSRLRNRFGRFDAMISPLANAVRTFSHTNQRPEMGDGPVAVGHHSWLEKRTVKVDTQVARAIQTKPKTKR